MGHSEVDVDFSVYSRFVESNYWLHKRLFSGRYSKWGASLHWTSQGFNSDGGQDDVVFKLKKILYGQAEAVRLWYEKLRNGFLEIGFVMRKVNPWLFISKTVICVVYVDACLFWARSQFDIDNVMKSFK